MPTALLLPLAKVVAEVVGHVVEDVSHVAKDFGHVAKVLGQQFSQQKNKFGGRKP